MEYIDLKVYIQY